MARGGRVIMAAMDVLIIGAGQAGLAMGYHLRQTPLRFQLVESNARLGDSWRQRYDSLVLFTPRMYSALPGLALAGDPEGYADKDELADYLEGYARHFDLLVTLGTSIQRLERQNGHFAAATSDGEVINARAVVLATGAFQKPSVPDIASRFSPDVMQFTPENYKNAAQIPDGTALVVGDGATGRDVASDLAASHHVLLAIGHPRRLLPERILGRSSWWWLDKLGILKLSSETTLGKRIQKSDTFPGRGKTLNSLEAQGVQVMPKLVSAAGRHVTFANGASTEIRSVIWATGYRDNSHWVAIPDVKDAHGNYIHQHGIAPIPNLYFIGRPWQMSRGSALITGVGADAQFIINHIIKRLGH
jgi:putative flavoprotein involved in K+ transport